MIKHNCYSIKENEIKNIKANNLRPTSFLRVIDVILRIKIDLSASFWDMFGISTEFRKGHFFSNIYQKRN